MVLLFQWKYTSTNVSTNFQSNISSKTGYWKLSQLIKHTQPPKLKSKAGPSWGKSTNSCLTAKIFLMRACLSQRQPLQPLVLLIYQELICQNEAIYFSKAHIIHGNSFVSWSSIIKGQDTKFIKRNTLLLGQGN